MKYKDVVNVLQVNTYDTDSGGAGRATYNLHQALMRSGVESRLILQSKTGDDPSVIGPHSLKGKIFSLLRPYLDTLPLTVYRKRNRTVFSTGFLPDSLLREVKRYDPDLINLHWIGGGYVNIRTLPRLKKPIVWSLYDSWAFTGGCHVPGACLRYQNSCGSCPLLASTLEYDLSRLNWKRKQNSWYNLKLTIVAPSRWLADCVQRSSIFKNAKVRVIPHVLNCETFQPVKKSEARQLLSLPIHKKLILFGAIKSTSDPNKGFSLLMQALSILCSTGWAEKAEVVVFGASTATIRNDVGMRVTYAGRLYDNIALRLLYSAADVMVVPSLQESLGLTGLEAMACGTPVVAFAATGLLDTVEHQRTGFLARAYSPEDLACGIAWVLSDDARWNSLSAEGRAKVKREFDVAHVASLYRALYDEEIQRWRDIQGRD